MSLVGQKFGEFEILERLGQGGMGAVYKARQTSLDRLVALKTLRANFAEDTEFIARFRQEARAAAGLNHPNLVRVHALGEDEGVHWFAMEYVEGESARVRLDRLSRLDPREAIAIILHVATALEYGWHKAALIHRDLKPDNIFLSTDGDVKLGDLGLAKQAGQSLNLTATGSAMGTPFYISPEQVQDMRDVDLRADIYSLGCTLFHLVSGRPPFEGGNGTAIMLKHITQPVPALHEAWPECPPTLDEAVRHMMQKDPAARPQTYAATIEELQRVYESIAPAPVVAPLLEPAAGERAPITAKPEPVTAERAPSSAERVPIAAERNGAGDALSDGATLPALVRAENPPGQVHAENFPREAPTLPLHAAVKKEAAGAGEQKPGDPAKQGAVGEAGQRPADPAKEEVAPPPADGARKVQPEASSEPIGHNIRAAGIREPRPPSETPAPRRAPGAAEPRRSSRVRPALILAIILAGAGWFIFHKPKGTASQLSAATSTTASGRPSPAAGASPSQPSATTTAPAPASPPPKIASLPPSKSSTPFPVAVAAQPSPPKLTPPPPSSPAAQGLPLPQTGWRPIPFEPPSRRERDTRILADGWWLLERGHHMHAERQYNVAIRAHLRMSSDNSPGRLVLRRTPPGVTEAVSEYALEINSEEPYHAQFTLRLSGRGNPTNGVTVLADFKLPHRLAPREEFDLAFSVYGSHLTAYLNGQMFGSLIDDYCHGEEFTVWGPAEFKTIEWAPMVKP